MMNKFLSLFKKAHNRANMDEDIYLLQSSELFDKSWYLTTYPDVAKAKVDPTFHYLHYGAFEGRNPGPNFSSKWYLDTYEDVKKTGINPLIHYLKYGKEEGRLEQPNNFYSALLREILEDVSNNFGSENWDEERFGPYNKPNTAYKRKILLQREFPDIMNHLEGFAALYDLLADKDSKATVVKLIAFRILGYQKVKLPFALTRDSNKDKKLAKSLMKSEETIKIQNHDWNLHHYDLHSIGLPIECFIDNPLDIMIHQYQYNKSVASVSIQPGDVVIDGGAFVGDTALDFANLVSESGKVYAFEFVPDHIEIMQKNLALNPHLASKIEIIPMALFDSTGIKLSYTARGSGTMLTNSSQDMSSAETVTLDDFVRKKSLDRIDFIKLDIEGSELSALRGAEVTLRKFRPKLAICLYHSLDDFTLIPEFLNKLNLSYTFYLDHYTIHEEETILFAYPRNIFD